jgi:hypothetical protein
LYKMKIFAYGLLKSPQNPIIFRDFIPFLQKFTATNTL